MIGRLLQRTSLHDWRAITGIFFATTLLESLALGHLDAFTPLFLRDELHLAREEIGPWTGLLSTATFAVAFPLAPLWGALAERFSRKLIIVRSMYLEALAYTLCAFAPDLTWFLVARLVLGLTFGNIAVIIATQSLLTPDRRLGSGISVVQAAPAIAMSFGPPLGALLLPFTGLRGLFLLDASVALLAALLITFLVPEPEAQARNRSVMGNMKQSAALVMRRPALRWNFASWFLVRGAGAVTTSYLPVRIAELQPDDPATAIGFVLGVFGILTSVVTWLSGQLIDRVGATRLFWPSMMLGTGLMVTMAVAPWLWLVTLMAWGRAIPVALSNTVLYAHLTDVVSRGERATVLSFTPVPRNMAAFSVPVFAAAAANAGTPAALLVAAAAYGLATLSGWKLLTSTPPPASPAAESAGPPDREEGHPL